MIEKSIVELLQKYSGVLYGYTSIDWSDFAKEYKSALVLAVPYDNQITLKNYSEEEFENSIGQAREKMNCILGELGQFLINEHIKYYIPPVAQNNEKELIAPFSFKYAATKAGIGWIGKNDVVITKQYGPQVRLGAIIIDYPFSCNEPYTQSKCPPNCTLCIDACPYKALKGVIWNSDIYRSELIDYHLCNEKRSLFLKKYGRKNACGLCMVACPFGTKKA